MDSIQKSTYNPKAGKGLRARRYFGEAAMYGYPAAASSVNGGGGGFGSGATPMTQRPSHVSLASGSATLATLERTMSQLPYRDRMRARGDVAPLLQQGFQYGHFSSCGATTFVTNEGALLELLVLEGTILIEYQGRKYNIPVEIFLPLEYPMGPPLAFVRPNSSMEVKPGHPVVDSNGSVCRLPYLCAWGHGGNLFALCGELSQCFSREPPVWTRPARTHMVANQQGSSYKSSSSSLSSYPLGSASSSSSSEPSGRGFNTSPSSSSGALSQVGPEASRKQQLVARLTERLRGDLDAYYDKVSWRLHTLARLAHLSHRAQC